jgi:hypothetical protein
MPLNIFPATVLLLIIYTWWLQNKKGKVCCFFHSIHTVVAVGDIGVGIPPGPTDAIAATTAPAGQLLEVGGVASDTVTVGADTLGTPNTVMF